MAYFILKAAGAMVAAGAIGIGAWAYATAWHPKASQYPLQGLDLGERPGPVEWGTVRARGADFAYLVATSAADRRDQQGQGSGGNQKTFHGKCPFLYVPLRTGH